MKRNVIAGIGVILAAALIAGCGGGGGQTAAPLGVATSAAVGPVANNQVAPLTITVQIPAAANTAGYRRDPAYISPSTSYIYATALPSNLSGQGSCNAGSCTVTLAAPLTTTSITVTLYGSSSQILSTATQAVSLTAGQTNTVNMVFNGVVHKFVPTTNVNQFVVGVSTPVTVTLTAYDALSNQIMPAVAYPGADGNLIDANNNVFVGASGTPQTMSIGVSGPDAGFLTLGALAWNSAAYTLQSTGTYNDGGAGVLSTTGVTLTPQTSAAATATMQPFSLAVNPKSIQIFANPLHTPAGYIVTTTTPASSTNATVEIGLYPTPSPISVYLAVIANFPDAGASLTVNNDNCESPGFSYNDPGINAAFPSPGPAMPAGSSYPFTVNIAGPSPSGSTNVSCSFTVNDATNGLSATTTFALDSPTFLIQGKNRK